MTYPIVEKLLLTPDCDVAAMRDACVEAAAHIEALAAVVESVVRHFQAEANTTWGLSADECRLLDGAEAALSNLREGQGGEQ